MSKDDTLKKYIIYALRNPVDKSLFYVGCTCGSLARRLNQHRIESGQKDSIKGQIITKIIEAGMRLEGVILDEATTYRNIAYWFESYWILCLRKRGEPLINQKHTSRDGGWMFCDLLPSYSEIEYLKIISALPPEEFGRQLSKYQTSSRAPGHIFDIDKALARLNQVTANDR